MKRCLLGILYFLLTAAVFLNHAETDQVYACCSPPECGSGACGSAGSCPAGYTCSWQCCVPEGGSNPVSSPTPPPVGGGGGTVPTPTTAPNPEYDCRSGSPCDTNTSICCSDGQCRSKDIGCGGTYACDDHEPCDSGDAGSGCVKKCGDAASPGSLKNDKLPGVSYDVATGKPKITWENDACGHTLYNCGENDGSTGWSAGCWKTLNIYRDGVYVTEIGKTNSFTYTDTGADPYVPHTYDFRAMTDINGNACSGCTNPPAACRNTVNYYAAQKCYITGLSAADPDCDSKTTTLSWTVNNASWGNKIIVKRHDGSGWTTEESSLSTGTSSVVPTVSVFGSYNYQVICVNGTSEDGASNVIL